MSSFAPCTEGPGAEFSSPGNQNITAIKVYGPWGQIMPLITTARCEPSNRDNAVQAGESNGCSGFQSRGLRFRPDGNLSLEDRESLCLSPSNSLPDYPFKLKATCVPKHLSVYLLFLTLQGYIFQSLSYNELHNECSSC